ncbi:MAG: alginate lyase family protein [Acidobacteriota bacterium]|nr:alginate lyase family protein [Acidobacteriota bacterium]
MRISRRDFCWQAGLLFSAGQLLRAQSGSSSAARIDVAAVERERVLQTAEAALAVQPRTITAEVARQSPGGVHDFYSEAPEWWPDEAQPGTFVRRADSTNPAAFRGHSQALLRFSLELPALVSAYVLTREDRFAAHAARHARAWFADEATRMAPTLQYAELVPGTREPRMEGVLAGMRLAEVAQALSFLTTSDALDDATWERIYAWFANLLNWLDTDKTAGLARDDKSHHATSWLLQCAAYARLLPPRMTTADTLLQELRHRYKTVTLRTQVDSNGNFAHELATSFPYRNTIMNLEMLAGACDLLSTRFESLWDYELQNGPGLRTVVARQFPFLANRNAWPYPADLRHFAEMPWRCSSLLLAARAYNQPEYAALWARTDAESRLPELRQWMPIQQPLLWVRRVRSL